MKSLPKCYSYLRFSNIKQKVGDSTRRQMQRAEEYAEKTGLKLDKSLNMKDEGLSGYTGKHIKEGNLGKFLALVESGRIATGSSLIIESIDRLSRQEPLIATDVIKLILRAGITLVVLGYKPRQYTDESIRNNPGELSGLVAEIERAYFESKVKADRLSEAWKEKRERAKNGGKKLTSISPLWLELSEDKTEFHIIHERAKAVRYIFQLKADGFGNGRIAEELNKNPDIWQPQKSKRNKTGGWAESTIQRILKEKRVLGEFQPHTKIDGKRKPVGDPIKDYYPPVVDENIFYAVHNRMRQWREKHGHSGGRTNKANNLFTSIAKCGECGETMHYSHKGKKGKEGGYLRCSLALQSGREKDGKTCDARSIYYTHFKEKFFQNVKELTVSNILPTTDEHKGQISKLTMSIDANGQRLEELSREEERLTAIIAKEWTPDAHEKFKNKLETTIKERKNLANRNEKLISQRIDLQRQSAEVQKNLDTLHEVRELLDSAETEADAIEIRQAIRRAIKKIIDRIEIYPSKKTTGRYKKVLIKFKGSEPYARSIFYTDVLGWRQMTRMKAPCSV